MCTGQESAAGEPVVREAENRKLIKESGKELLILLVLGAQAPQR